MSRTQFFAKRSDPAVAWQRLCSETKTVPISPGFLNQGNVRGVWWNTAPAEIPPQPQGVVRFVCISDTHEHVESAEAFSPKCMPPGMFFFVCCGVFFYLF